MNTKAGSKLPGIAARLQHIPLVVQQYGWTRTLKLYGFRLQERLRDRRLGIRTDGYLGHEQLGYGKEYNEYEPANYSFLDMAFGYLDPREGHDVLLEYGCGKGRVVAVAATWPMRRVIGVELAEELSAAARRNVESARRHFLCQDVSIVTADATRYQVPDDVNLIFLLNTVIGEALVALLERIRESLLRNPRALRIAYLQSGPVNLLNDCAWLQRAVELPMPECTYTLDRNNAFRFFVYVPSE